RLAIHAHRWHEHRASQAPAVAFCGLSMGWGYWSRRAAPGTSFVAQVKDRSAVDISPPWRRPGLGTARAGPRGSRPKRVMPDRGRPREKGIASPGPSVPGASWGDVGGNAADIIKQRGAEPR